MRNIPYYFTAAIIFIVLKFWFSDADNNDLVFLLKPSDMLIGFLTGSSSVFISDYGFYHENMKILIDKSCSGFNFWILCFLLFSYLIIKHIDKPLHKTLAVPISLIIAYFLTIIVNTSRIFISIVLQNLTSHILPNHQNILHASTGVLIYLSFLILTYCLTEYILNYFNSYYTKEKS